MRISNMLYKASVGCEVLVAFVASIDISCLGLGFHSLFILLIRSNWAIYLRQLFRIFLHLGCDSAWYDWL